MVYFLIFLVSSFNEAGGIFLIITPGAKAVALGSAFTAICDDATACYYNPGSLALFEKAKVSSMNLCPPPGIARWSIDGYRYFSGSDVPAEGEWLPGLYPGMHHYYWSAMVPFKKGEAVGVSYNYFSSGETYVTDENGNEIGPWITYDYAAGLTYAKEIRKDVGIGSSIKYIYSFLCPHEILDSLNFEGNGFARTFAIDFGLFAKSLIPGVNFGYSIQNVGPGMKYVEKSEGDPLPRLMRNGVAFSPITTLDAVAGKFNFPIQLSNLFAFTIAWDYTTDLIGKEHDTWSSYGKEFTFFTFFSVRKGHFRKGHFKDTLGPRIGDTEGYGLRIGALQLDIGTDTDIYALYTENWRVQWNLREYEKPEIAKKNKNIDNLLKGLSCALLPGGGQFYNDEPIKGIPILALSSYLGHMYYTEKKSLSLAGIALLYLGSAFEAFYKK